MIIWMIQKSVLLSSISDLVLRQLHPREPKIHVGNTRLTYHITVEGLWEDLSCNDKEFRAKPNTEEKEFRQEQIVKNK